MIFKNSMEVPQKIENKTTTWFSNSISGYISKGSETCISKFICTSLFTEALFTIAEIWNEPKCPSIFEWIKKMWHAYTMEYNSAKKNRKNLVICNMDEPVEHILSEISQAQKDKYCMIALVCGVYNSWTHRSRVGWWLPGARGWGTERDVGQRVPNFNTAGQISSSDLKYSKVTIVDNTVLYTWN